MDSNDLEKERGITILAKNCAVEYEGTHINIVDTPGHADFGGEVERVLSMVDGVLLLVDAVEGPMPQTRFVTKKALALGLRPIVVVNKVDRPGARIEYVENSTFELFDKLGATEEQLDFPIVYASGLNGFSGLTSDVREGDMRSLFETIIKYVPVRDDDVTGPLQFQISSIDYNSYVGKIGVGRVSRGTIKPGMDVMCVNGPGGESFKGRINQCLKFKGLEREQVSEAIAGDIVLINGIEDIAIGTTICAMDHLDPLPMLKVDEPTLTMNFMVNTSPLAGREGKFVTSRQLRDRLDRELKANMALRVKDNGLVAFNSCRINECRDDRSAQPLVSELGQNRHAADSSIGTEAAGCYGFMMNANHCMERLRIKRVKLMLGTDSLFGHEYGEANSGCVLTMRFPVTDAELGLQHTSSRVRDP